MFFNKGRIAYVSDSDSDIKEISKKYSSLNWKCDSYRSDEQDVLVRKSDKYNVIMIDFKLGGGLLSVEIAKLLISGAYEGKVFFIAGGSMELYSDRYGIVIMKDRVLDDPEMIFNIEVADNDRTMDTVFITECLMKGGL